MKTLNIQTQIADPEVAFYITKVFATLPDIQATTSDSTLEPRKTLPEIIILDESTCNGAIFDSLWNYRQKLPDAAIFLISSQQSPEHVVKSIKAGASEFFPLPLDLDYLRQCIEEVRAKTTAAGKQTHSTVYSFISSKGGLGATVLAVNTAVAMTGRDATVALCDLNLRTGDSSVLLDLVPKASIVDLTRDFQRLDSALLKNTMTPHDSGVQLLAAPPQPDAGYRIEVGQIKGIIAQMSGIFGKTVIDCPSVFPGETTVGALGSSDRIFIVLELSVPAIRNAARLAKELGAMGIREERIEFVVNRFVKNSVISVKEADRSLGKAAFWIFPNAYEEVFSSTTSGLPLVNSHPRSAFGKSVRQFAEKLSNPEAHKGFRGISTLFGKPM